VVLAYNDLLAIGVMRGLHTLARPVTRRVTRREPVTVPTRPVVRSSTTQRNRKSTSPALGTTKVSGSAS
jgi:hypothetical protein